MAKFIKPFYDRVVLEVLEDERVGSIHIAKAAEKGQRAKVVAVGPGKYNMDTDSYTKMHVEPGDIVFVHAKFATAMRFGMGSQKNYVMVKEDEILGLEVEVDDD